MTEVLEVVNGFPALLKGAWVVWLVWGACQVAWYGRGRTAIVRQLPAPRPRPRPAKPSPPAESAGPPVAHEPATPDSRVA